MRVKGRKSGRRRLSRTMATALAGLLTLLGCLGLLRTWPSVTDVLANPLFDSYQRLKPRTATEETSVAVIDIDEASIARLGQWPWSRQVIAGMVERLSALGVAAIGFDIVFSEPDRLSLGLAVDALRRQGAQVSLPAGSESLDSDAALARSLGAAGAVTGLALTDETSTLPPKPKAGFAYGGSDPKTYLPRYSGAVANIPILDAAASGIGFFSFATSHDNVIRTMPLVAVAGDALYPALSVETLRVAQGAQGFAIRSSDASGEGGGGIPGMATLRVGELDIPTASDGRLRVYYSGLRHMPVVSAADLMSGRSDQELATLLEGRIVLVGASAIGLRDIVATPVASAVPGVTIHAEIIDQIVASSFLQEPGWADGATLLATLVAGSILIAVASRSGAFASSSTLVILSAVMAAASWLAFAEAQYILDPVGAIATLILLFLVLTPLRLALATREKMFVKRAFGRYLAPALVSRLADEPGALELGGETRHLTVLFSDIRGFTTLSEGMDPQRLTGLLNRFLTPLTDVLLAREATIDKYIGDAIMAFWNAPLDIAGHEEKACRAALDMANAVEALNRAGDEKIRIGIGLNTGDACVGNLGSDQRFSYSALGDSVNLASRIESLTKFYGLTIAVTETTRDGAPDLAYLEADHVRVKGRSEPVRVYALLGDETMVPTDAFQALARAQHAFLEAYRSGRFEQAQVLLALVRDAGHREVEGLCRMYEERIADLSRNPPGTDWDGVYVAPLK